MYFRYLNEQFYVSSSTDAKDYFEKNPEEFIAYHKGYQQQASLWPKNPIDEIIKDLQRRYFENLFVIFYLQNFTQNISRLKSGKQVIADFGCGEAKLAQALEETNSKIFSFDLVATNKYVTACDMSQTNLFSGSVDVVVFCLSLMGSNLSQFIREANRVLKDE